LKDRAIRRLKPQKKSIEKKKSNRKNQGGDSERFRQENTGTRGQEFRRLRREGKKKGQISEREKGCHPSAKEKGGRI